jgi:DNA ligase-associated metallophosphoesterase
MQIELAGTPIILLHEKAIFLPLKSILVLGDLHLGKAMHFRKAGIFMPVESALKDYQTLHKLMSEYKPLEVFFLGDLFHSNHNSEWQQFAAFIQSFPRVSFTLIKGNHDVLKESFYQQLNINIIPKVLQVENLLFSHEPMNEIPPETINIAGHIHPGCIIRGLGRQQLRLPCFYLKDAHFLMPAFGNLTGLQIMEHQNATLFAILPDKVVAL